MVSNQEDGYFDNWGENIKKMVWIKLKQMKVRNCLKYAQKKS